MGSHQETTDQRLYRAVECEVPQGSSDNGARIDHTGQSDKTGGNLAYISAEITNSKGELCNEGEAIYFLMNQEKAKEMGFLHCEVED